MVPQTQPRKPSNSSKVNLLISLIFHGVIVLGGFYLAARGGLLGKEMKKLAVFKAEEKQPEKKEPEKPKAEPPKQEPPKEAPKVETPKVQEVQAPPPTTAAPSVAPAAAIATTFDFAGGAAVMSGSGVDVYKGMLQSAFTSKWKKPDDEDDQNFVAEVDVAVGKDGTISNPQWVKKSGDARWDNSVRDALVQVSSLDHAPPTNFPSHIVIRFDVAEQKDSMIQ